MPSPILNNKLRDPSTSTYTILYSSPFAKELSIRFLHISAKIVVLPTPAGAYIRIEAPTGIPLPLVRAKSIGTQPVSLNVGAKSSRLTVLIFPNFSLVLAII